jgi:hypothetical protein
VSYDSIEPIVLSSSGGGYHVVSAIDSNANVYTAAAAMKLTAGTNTVSLAKNQVPATAPALALDTSFAPPSYLMSTSQPGTTISVLDAFWADLPNREDFGSFFRAWFGNVVKVTFAQVHGAYCAPGRHRPGAQLG